MLLVSNVINIYKTIKDINKNKSNNRTSKDSSLDIDDLTIPLKSKQEEKEKFVAKLSEEELGSYLKAFSNFDKNGDGTISKKELLQVMRTLGDNPTEDQMTYIMLQMDVDGNGKIDFEEFLGMMAKRRGMYDSMEDLRMAFEVFDANGDGTISVEELRDVMKETFTKEEIDEIIEEGDKDNDGVIDYQEFAAMLRSI